MKRVGKCDYKKCGGICCRITILSVDRWPDDAKEILAMRIGFIQFVNYNGHEYVVLDSPCRELRLDTGECKIQGTKPDYCKEFPTRFNPVLFAIMPECTYQWVPD